MPLVAHPVRSLWGSQPRCARCVCEWLHRKWDGAASSHFMSTSGSSEGSSFSLFIRLSASAANWLYGSWGISGGGESRISWTSSLGWIMTGTDVTEVRSSSVSEITITSSVVLVLFFFQMLTMFKFSPLTSVTLSSLTSIGGVRGKMASEFLH